MCFVLMLTSLHNTSPVFVKTSTTFVTFPLSAPAMTMTLSFVLTCIGMRTGRPFFVMACFSHFFFCKYQNQRHGDAAHVSLTFANECAAHEINPQTRRRPLSRPEHPKPSTSRARPLPPRAPRARRQPRARAPLNRRVPYASTPSHHHARPRP